MTLILSLLVNVVLLAALWRLKGPRTVMETARLIIQGGGGTGPRQNQ